MSQSLALLVLVAIVVAFWIDGWAHAQKIADYVTRHEIERLHYQIGWLRDRLELARRENWDGETIASLEAELEATRRRWFELMSRR
jgi:hypothetical protein